MFIFRFKHCLIAPAGLQKSASEESPMKLRDHLSRFRQPHRPERDKRLGVPLGILWGLAISVILWALIRWVLGAAITVLAGF